MQQRLSSLYTWSYYLWLILFVLAPLGLLLYQSLVTSDGQWTWENYRYFFTSSSYLLMTFNSFVYAGLVTGVTLLIGYPTAYFLTQSKHQRLWLLLAIIPTWINLLLKTYAFIGLLSRDGWLNQLLIWLELSEHSWLFTHRAFLLVAMYVELPFMLLPIYQALAEIPSSLIEASQDLGASSWVTFWRVLVPLSANGVKSGVQAVFIPSLSLFMLTRLIGGNRVITLGTAVEQHFLVTQNWSLGATIGVVLMLAMAVMMYLTRSRSLGGATHDQN